MSKSWTPEELAAASAAMKAEGHMSYEEFCAAPVLRLEHRGRDSWGRPVYECDGRLYISKMRRQLMPFPWYDAKVAAMQHGRHGRTNTLVVKFTDCWSLEIISVHSANERGRRANKKPLSPP